MSRSALSIVMILGFVAQTMAGKTMSVTTCGQVVPPGTTATLTKTIVCPPWGVCYPACVQGDPACFHPLQPVVTCRSTAECPDPVNDNCAFPPGVTSSVGIYMGKGASLQMNSHSVSGAFIGIVSGNPSGTGSGKMKITGPGSIFGNQQGIVYPTNLKVSGISLHDNAYIGISGTKRLRLENVVGKNNGVLAGAGKRITAIRVTATGNGAGLGSAGSLTIVDSSITGSTSVDIESVRRPRLRNTVCGKSAQLLLPQNTLGPPWGVCTDD
jgi:hypothetical protein